MLLGCMLVALSGEEAPRNTGVDYLYVNGDADDSERPRRRRWRQVVHEREGIMTLLHERGGIMRTRTVLGGNLSKKKRSIQSFSSFVSWSPSAFSCDDSDF